MSVKKTTATKKTAVKKTAAASKKAAPAATKKPAVKSVAKTKTPRPRTYAQAGVDIDQGEALVDHLKTINPSIGGFGGLFPIPRGYKRPQLVASTDGVGTKLLVAIAAGQHATIGQDLVAMVVNDLIVCNARPLFFLDYFATGKLEQGQAKEILTGIVDGCELADCPLIGGETAEMPGMYGAGHYDLAGFGVGVVEADQVLDGSQVRPGDVVLGLGSTGLHSNGYSLARDVLLGGSKATPAQMRKALSRKIRRGGPSLADVMLAPTRIYVRTVLDLIKRGGVTAAAHITGGGIAGNLVRVLPKGVQAYVDLAQWQPGEIFELIAQEGPVEEAEMLRTFNMGIGFIVVVRPEAAKRLMARAERLGERCLPIGWIAATDGPAKVEIVRGE